MCGQAREVNAARVYEYTGTTWKTCQGTSGQARTEGAATVYGYAGTVWPNSLVELNGERVYFAVCRGTSNGGRQS